MSAGDEKEIDAVSGVETTGHEWDGIKELNNPLPSWWLYTFYGTIVWSIIYTIAFPAWPMITEATKGMLGYSSRKEVAVAIEEAKEAQAGFVDKIAAMPLEEVSSDQGLMSFALAGGAAAFRTNCSQCHGAGAAGAVGYPNLLDDDWIWGGELEEIQYTITHGIRQTDSEGYPTDDTRQNQMPAYGRDEILSREEIAALVEHVRKISGQEFDAGLEAEGATLFEENCTVCHGDNGEGMQDLGAPNLTDAIWLYGGERTAIRTSVETGRGSMMPAWGERLSDSTIKQLALYVHSLGGGQ